MIDSVPPKIEPVDPRAEIGMLTKLFVPFRKSGPILRHAAAISDLSDKRYMSRKHCYLYLGRRVREAQLASERQTHFFGRLFNKISGSRTDTVDVSGAVLRTTLETLAMDLPRGLSNDGTYRVRLDVAEELWGGFKKIMCADGLVP